jgi:hypothetical protein
MVSVDTRPDAGGNYLQPEDGRDERGQLPEPLDAARPIDDDLVILLPGQPPSQAHGTGPVVSASPQPAAAGEQLKKNASDDTLTDKLTTDATKDAVADAEAMADKAEKAPKSGPGLTTKNTPARPAK